MCILKPSLGIASWNWNANWKSRSEMLIESGQQQQRQRSPDWTDLCITKTKAEAALRDCTSVGEGRGEEAA